MKSLIALLTLGGLLCMLCACAAAGTAVPDQLIMEVVEESFENAQIRTEHDMDDETHIDTVDVEVTSIGEFGEEYYVGVCAFKYHKSDDTWEYEGDEPEWEYIGFELVEEKFIGEFDSGLKTGGIFNADITSIDFENCTVTGNFYAREINYIGDCLVDESGTFEIVKHGSYYTLEIPWTHNRLVDIVLEVRFSLDGVEGMGFTVA